MDYTGKHVRHKTIGEGIIKEHTDGHVKVQFGTKESKFIYPDAFKQFLTLLDEELDIQVKGEIADAEMKVEAEKKRKAEEEKRRIELADQKNSRSSESTKPIKRVERIADKPKPFIVFQGGTFDSEYIGGYIWAPKYTQSGGTCHHWDRLLDVRQGDIIIHCAGGYIEAISVAKGPCYDAVSPAPLQAVDMWQKDGRKVDCDYIKIPNPIKHSSLKSDILKYCGVKYAPFDKDGNGNMGYLYEVDRNLAKIFIEASVKANSYLLNSVCILDFLRV